MRTTRLLSAVLAAGALIGVAACGGDNSGNGAASTTAASTATTASASPSSSAGGVTTTAAGGGGPTTTAAPQKADASKPPVLVGFHNLEGGAVSLPEIRQAFLSGISYVNEELGGINGRPLKAETCNVDVTPESSVNCANQFVEKKVVVAVQGVDIAADAALPIWGQAGLVDVGFAAYTPVLNASRGKAFITIGDSRDILAQNLIMQQKLGAKKVAWMVLNAASAKAYYDSVIKPIAQKLNLQVDPYYYESTTDWATLAATVLSTNPDGIDFPSAEESVCLAAIPAFRNGGFTKTLHASECSNYVDQLPLNQVEGIVNDNLLYFETFTSIPPKVQHDFDIFNRYMARDIPKLSSQVYGEFGFHIAVQVADMLRQIQGDITPQTVAQTMPKTKGSMFFRDTGYDCSINYWPPDSSACSSNMIYTRTNKDKKKELLDINPVDASAVRPKA